MSILLQLIQFCLKMEIAEEEEDRRQRKTSTRWRRRNEEKHKISFTHM